MSKPESPGANGLSYKDAGVDIDRGNRLVERIKPLARSTRRPELLGGIGGFGALMQVPLDRYREPVLVSGTDGVGTKLRLAIDWERHRGVGIDLVAMCVNDILTLGAEPFFFLDYLATGRLDEDVAAEVIAGIADGCLQAGAALIGGETAEMPGMYAAGDYDVAGFCVGLVEKTEIIDGAAIASGDRLIALPSSGPHSNGYSLIRKILEVAGVGAPDATLADGSSLADALLAPTRIYVPEVARLREAVTIKGLAHITGGGLTENIPRMLGAGLGVRIDLSAWRLPAVFAWLQDKGGVSEAEMRRTFNCGVGMIACVAAKDAERALHVLNEAGEAAFDIGEVVEVEGGAADVSFEG